MGGKVGTYLLSGPHGTQVLGPGWAPRHRVRGLAPLGTVLAPRYEGPLETAVRVERRPPVLTKDDQPPLSSSWLSVEKAPP